MKKKTISVLQSMVLINKSYSEIWTEVDIFRQISFDTLSSPIDELKMKRLKIYCDKVLTSCILKIRFIERNHLKGALAVFTIYTTTNAQQ